MKWTIFGTMGFELFKDPDLSVLRGKKPSMNIMSFQCEKYGLSFFVILVLRDELNNKKFIRN